LCTSCRYRTGTPAEFRRVDVRTNTSSDARDHPAGSQPVQQETPSLGDPAFRPGCSAPDQAKRPPPSPGMALSCGTRANPDDPFKRGVAAAAWTPAYGSDARARPRLGRRGHRLYGSPVVMGLILRKEHRTAERSVVVLDWRAVGPLAVVPAPMDRGQLLDRSLGTDPFQGPHPRGEHALRAYRTLLSVPIKFPKTNRASPGKAQM
jgi:hypothetical protein